MKTEGITRFAFSGEAHAALVDKVQGHILFDEIHPLVAYAREIGFDFGSDEGRAYRKVFFNEKPRIDRVYIPAMPEADELLDVCLQMGIHPADLLPLNSTAPLPRSVVQTCVHIFDDGDNFPHADRNHACCLLDYERFEVEGFQMAYPSLWKIMQARHTEMRLSRNSVIPIEVQSPLKGQRSLNRIFGYVLYGHMAEDCVYRMPDEIDVNKEIERTGCDVPEDIDTAFAYFENDQIMKAGNEGSVELDTLLQRI